MHPTPAAQPTIRSPFVRLTELLGDTPPGRPAINLSVGEPQHAIPDFVGPILAAHVSTFNRYPHNRGTDAFRAAAAAWLGRRYALPRPIDPAREVLGLAGTREGLFLAAIAARRFVTGRKGDPAILVPNPFYPAYQAGSEAAFCETVPLHAPPEQGFMPDLDALDPALLDRTVALYFASPANPQGAVASRELLARMLELARRHGFLVFSDECYSEIWSQTPPTGLLEVAGPDYSNAVVFHSLSKRSSLAGLRAGFCAGDARFMDVYGDLRTVAAPQVPLPVQEVAIAAYGDEVHVEESRQLYMRKFDIADRILGNRFGYRRPAGGFFLWLDVAAEGGGIAVTRRLWQDAGVRVVPGEFLARDLPDGSNPGRDYIRVAMVHDVATTEEGLRRLVDTLT